MTNHPLIAPKPMPVNKAKTCRNGAYREVSAICSPIGGLLLLVVLSILIGKVALA
ncbi:hypothetical protein [uncultured Shewanella sp.]|uniref:hypothetical protein n=1 Tax=Shewanella atlantica TaxID=271099 RepID=UPI00260918C2|nr:hypothetical protein [uncultured Shewanella sp.]